MTYVPGTVWIITTGDYDAYEVLCAFTTEQEAKQFIADYNAEAKRKHRSRLDAGVERLPLNPATYEQAVEGRW